MIQAITKFIERGKKGYCRQDIWSFGNWLSKLIANGLREFKQDCRTYSNDIDDWDEWMKILDEMIECFDEQERKIDNILDKNFLQVWIKRREYQKERLHRGLALLERCWYDLWD